MIPKIITPTELRQQLAHFLDLASDQLILVKDKKSTKVILDESEYNRLSALAHQFEEEDPEGEYRPEFVEEVLRRSRDNDIDESVKSLKDLIC